MIRVTVYQNNNKKIAEAYGKWFPRVVSEETIGLDELSEHMASHNTPFSKGSIKGILTDAVVCTKELLLQGKSVKFPDLAIFSIGLRLKGGGAPTKEDFTVGKYIQGLKLRARATGELTSDNLDTTIKRVDLAKSENAEKTDTPSSGDNKGDSPTTPGGSGNTEGGGSGGGVVSE